MDLNPAVMAARGIPIGNRAKASALTLRGYNANLKRYGAQQMNDVAAVALGVQRALDNRTFSPTQNPYGKILNSPMFHPGMGDMDGIADWLSSLFGRGGGALSQPQWLAGRGQPGQSKSSVQPRTVVDLSPSYDECWQKYGQHLAGMGDGEIDAGFVDSLPYDAGAPSASTGSSAAGWTDILNTLVGGVAKGIAGKIGGPQTVVRTAPPTTPSWIVPAALVGGAGVLYLLLRR